MSYDHRLDKIDTADELAIAISTASTSIQYKPRLRSTTWANRDSAALYNGEQVFFSDLERISYSDGIKWVYTPKADLVNVRRKNKKDYQKSPLIQAPLWAATTAYTVGKKVRHSNGQLLICVVAGTSLSSEPTFSSTALIAEASGPSWSALGKASTVNTDGYQVPAITVSATIPVGAASNPSYDSAVLGSIAAVIITTGGTGYVDGTYLDVPATTLTGIGTGAVIAKIVVASGVVTSMIIPVTGAGNNFTNLDTFSVNNAYLGGSGSGLLVTISQIWQISKPDWFRQNAIKTSWLNGGTSTALIMDTGTNSFPAKEGTRVIEFISDDPKIGIGIRNYGLFLNVLVDGYPIEESPTALSSNDPSYYIIDWSGVTVERTYTIKMAATAPFKNVAVLPSSTLRPSTDSMVYGVYYGDSYSSIVSSYVTPLVNYPGEDLSTDIFARIGIKYARNHGVSGAGYITGKSVSDNNTTANGYRASAQIAFNDDSDIVDNTISVVCAHGLNDVGGSTSAIASAAILAWTSMRAKHPKAVISIFGPWSENSGPSANVLALDTALADAFSAWGDSMSFYHSICNDPAGSWTTGTGKWGTTTGTGNADFYVGSDNTHPSIPGRTYLIKRMAACIENDLSLIGL